MIWQVVVACIGSAGLWTFIQYLINRKDERNGKLTLITKQLERLEKDNCRTQMLILMNHYSDNVQEILKVAEYYFKELDGDWYLTALFKSWLRTKHIGKPEWFDVNK